MSMTKIDIVESIYKKTSIQKKECADIVGSIFEIIKSEFAKGNDVMISGFGKWFVLKKKARKGRNPQTGEALMIAARKVVTFKPSTVLKNKLATLL